MDRAKKNWDKIPSLEGLEVEWDYQPDSALGKRTHVRMTTRSLASLINMHTIPIKIATIEQTFTARLHDLGVGGVAINSKQELQVRQPIKIGFYLGKKKIISQAEVRWVKKFSTSYRIGLMFVNLKEESEKYIAGLYSSKKIAHY